jgi:hypothetical protein
LRTTRNALLMLGVVVALLAALFLTVGFASTWRIWNIPTMSPAFADLQVITYGARSAAQGFDPLVSNPADPWGRPLNYPRVWQSLFVLGIDPSHTILLAGVIIVAFFAGLLLVLRDASDRTLILAFFAILSPATMLALERGNIDLLMFFLVAVAVVSVRRLPALATFMVFAALVLKLYPLFAVVVLLALPRKAFLRHLAVLVACAACYIALTLPDILLIGAGTPHTDELSYGIDVVWMDAARFGIAHLRVMQIATYAMTALIIVGACAAGLVARDDDSTSERASALDAFRAGAAIYVGTYLLRTNYDYRLIFLIMTIPQLYAWSRSTTDRVAMVSRVSLAATFIALWYLHLSRLSDHAFVLDEVSHWTLFGGFLYLLCRSAPTWLKEIFQGLVSRRIGRRRPAGRRLTP